MSNSNGCEKICESTNYYQLALSGVEGLTTNNQKNENQKNINRANSGEYDQFSIQLLRLLCS